MSKRHPLSTPERHQQAIAAKSLRMSDAADGLLGGPTKAEARVILARLGWSERRIANLEAE